MNLNTFLKKIISQYIFAHIGKMFLHMYLFTYCLLWNKCLQMISITCKTWFLEESTSTRVRQKKSVLPMYYPVFHPSSPLPFWKLLVWCCWGSNPQPLALEADTLHRATVGSAFKILIPYWSDYIFLNYIS